MDGDTQEMIPLKPLAAWLAGYTAPPRDSLKLVLPLRAGSIHDQLTEAWERTLRDIDWRADDE